MIVGRAFLMLTCNANLAKFNGLNFQIQPCKSRAHRAHVHSHRGRGRHHTGSTWSSTRAWFALSYEQVVATTLLLFQGFLPIVWELMFLLRLRTILIKVSGRQLWFFPRHFRVWPYCSHSDRRLSSAHLWQAQWSSQQWTAWQCMNHGGLAQVPSLGFVTRRSDLSAIITTACNKFSNINCTVPALEPGITNTILPPPWLWLHVFSTMHNCVNCGLTITKLWEDAKTASQEDAESHQALEKGAEKNCDGDTFVHPHTRPLFL